MPVSTYSLPVYNSFFHYFGGGEGGGGDMAIIYWKMDTGKHNFHEILLLF